MPVQLPIIDNHSHSCSPVHAANGAACPSNAIVYVCICNGVTDHAIREAAEAGCRTMTELTMRTGAGSTCGSCIEMATAILDETRTRLELPLPVLREAA